MQEKVTKFPGLISQFNSLNLSPGAMIRANNCVIRRENVIEDRRGYKVYGTVTNNITQLMTYENRVIAHNGTDLSYDNGSGTFADYTGSYSAVSGRKLRSVEASSNLFVTTSAGVKVFSDITGSQGRLAGAPRALNASYSVTGSTGFLANNYQCAYRSLIQRTDSRGNVVRGYPSQRLWVSNSAGAARNIALTIYIPSEAAATDVIQVYRTEQVSGTSDDTAGDEMGLVYQYELVSADISAGYITFTDSVTDALRGATLYTSPSEEGILQANDRPPVAKDICLYKTFMLYANVETKQRLNSTLVGTAALGFATTGDTNSNTTLSNVASVTNVAIGWKVEGTNIPAGTTVSNVSGSTITLSQAATGTTVGGAVRFYTDKTITLAGTTYYFGSSEIISGAGSPQIKVFTSGVAASDIDSTARSIENLVNRYASNTTIYAYYTSGAGDLPGSLLYEERGLGASAFTLQSNSSVLSGMFFPQPPVSPSTTTQCTSTKDTRTNAVAVAKSQQNEHVPALNYLLVGPSNTEILRVVALRDSAIVVKEEGVYRITGDTFNNMTVTPIDLTVYCLAAESVAVLANQVFMLSNQGVVLVSEGGAQVISREIEPTLLPLLSNSYLSSATVGAAYESERSYFLSTLTDASDTVATQTLVYNIFTRTWVRHTYAFNSAVVPKRADKMYFSKASDDDVYVERKDFADTDYADPEKSITITSLSSTTIEFTLSGATPENGWVILQGTTGIAIEGLTVISGGFRATLKETPPASWVVGAATIYPSVKMDLEFHSFTGQQSPEVLKQVREVGIFSDDIPGNNSVSSLFVSFRSNFDKESEEVELEPPGEGWGSAWGSSSWGSAGDSHGYPTYVPRNKQYCNRLTVGILHKNAREKLVITGIGFEFEAVSGNLGR